MNCKEKLLEVRDLHKVYTKEGVPTKALNGITFNVLNGEYLGIMGASGSGKTTLCNLIGRFWDVESGAVLVGGQNVKDYTLEGLMDQISMVFQKVYLFADTVENNIKFGCPNATHEEVVAAAKKACCHDFILTLPQGYDTVIGEGGSSLSGGEKQRISIARAILKDAPIVILDEATASLDAESEALIQQELDRLVEGRTALIVAHRFSSIRVATRILVFEGGRIVGDGSHAELYASCPLYRELYDRQSL